MPAVTLDSPVAGLGRLTKRHKEALATLRIETVRDLIFHFPFRHEDFSATVPIAEAPVGQTVTINAKVTGLRQRKSFRRRLAMAEASLEDEFGGKITAVWFNQPYIANMLPVGTTCRFAGKVSQTKLGRRLVNPMYQPPGKADSAAYVSPLIPVYSTPAGLTQLMLRRLIDAAKPAIEQVEEHLPAELVSAEGLMPLAEALQHVHFPPDQGSLRAARKRLAFDEMLRLQLAVGQLRRERQSLAAPAVQFDEAGTKTFVGRLPFQLTDDQRRAGWEILQDMQRPHPMNRLLDGDVGTGKTVVAALAMINAARAGYQSALMAPTEILAKQHFETLKKLFAAEGVTLALWTNSYKRSAADGAELAAAGKKETELLGEEIAAGRIQAVIGTHALVMDSLRFDKLALAIVDEQHRFGVNTRQKLVQKSGLPDQQPHLLSMTATPIPRSLALTVYGDLELSLLREKPANRQPIKTKLVAPTQRNQAFAQIREQIAAGRQAFVVCPLIGESDKSETTSVDEAFAQLSQIELHGIPLAKLHGKLSADEKEQVMADFLEQKTKVLVSTSVVEVGVDVPNATVMAIEGAERFGLAQLHQFRGRVGRGEHRSFCFLLPGTTSPESLARLKALEETNDGFELAEKDLRLRGAGQLLGKAQSGHSGLNLANLADLPLVKRTRSAADRLLDQDDSLKRWPALRQLVTRLTEEPVHLE
jgi:ATP-dependent DNA helicase RecG